MHSQKVVTLVRIEVQGDVSNMILLDRGFRRNDENNHFLMSCETINFMHFEFQTI